MKTKEEVIEWLREKKVYGKWLNARLIRNQSEPWNPLTSGDRFIDRSFNWSSTDDGHEFWCAIHEQFTRWW